MYHNIIQLHNSDMWDLQDTMEYFLIFLTFNLNVENVSRNIANPT